MTYYTGRTGFIKIGQAFSTEAIATSKVAKVRDWSLDVSVNLLGTETIDSVVTTFTPGIKSATGSGTLLYYRLEPGDETEPMAAFTAILSKVMKQGAVETTDRIQLHLATGPDPKDLIVCNAYITQCQVSTSTGELAVVPFQFTVDGDFINVVDA